MKQTLQLIRYLKEELSTISESAFQKIVSYLEKYCPCDDVAAYVGYDKDEGEKVVLIQAYEDDEPNETAYSYYFDLNGEYRSTVELV